MPQQTDFLSAEWCAIFNVAHEDSVDGGSPEPHPWTGSVKLHARITERDGAKPFDALLEIAPWGQVRVQPDGYDALPTVALRSETLERCAGRSFGELAQSGELLSLVKAVDSVALHSLDSFVWKHARGLTASAYVIPNWSDFTT